MSAFHQLVLPGLGGEELPLAQFGDRITLVVNVASQCGLTPQYAGLERLQQQYAARGFSVLGVPCNQFAAQEPGSDDEIRSFCTLNYGVSFPLSGKLEVNGPQRHPLVLRCQLDVGFDAGEGFIGEQRRGEELLATVHDTVADAVQVATGGVFHARQDLGQSSLMIGIGHLDAFLASGALEVDDGLRAADAFGQAL